MDLFGIKRRAAAKEETDLFALARTVESVLLEQMPKCRPIIVQNQHQFAFEDRLTQLLIGYTAGVADALHQQKGDKSYNERRVEMATVLAIGHSLSWMNGARAFIDSAVSQYDAGLKPAWISYLQGKEMFDYAMQRGGADVYLAINADKGPSGLFSLLLSI